MAQGDAQGLPKAPRITAETAKVDFRKMTAQDIMNRHRAISHQVYSLHLPIFCPLNKCNPQRPLVTYLPSKKSVQLLSLSIHKPPPNKSLLPVSMARYDPHSQSLLIRCAKDTMLSVNRVKQETRNELDVKEWWNGVRPEYKERDEQGNLAGVMLGLDEDRNPLGKVQDV